MESMECGNLCPYEKGTQKIPVCDEILSMNSDSFRVDMETFSHLTNYNPRFNLQRSLSRKGSQIAESVDINEKRDAISSPKDIMSEKSTPVIIVATDQQLHHQIAITTGATTTTTTSTAVTPTKSRLIGKRSNSFKQTPVISPRRILFLFATMSSMGTILLIYFTLSMAKYNQDDNLLNQ